MKTLKRTYKITSTRIVLGVLFGLLFTALSCKKDDGPSAPLPEPVAKTVFGQWELTSGTIVLPNSKYVHINENNTINILSEDELGFKREFNANISVTENQITLSAGFGSEIYNYDLNEDSLTITVSGGTEITLSRNASIPQADTWYKTLNVLDEGNAPWDGDVDIAYNGTQILYGVENGGGEIGLINPVTYALDGTIPTTRSAYAVEVEKYDSASRYIFQSSNGSSKFYAYIEATNNWAFDSEETGPWIQGLASIDSEKIWVSSGNEKALYLYRYDGVDEILETINLAFQPDGLDYQDGYLYVADGRNMHKCQTTPTFKAIESYKLPDHNVYGIAFDGTNFWLSTYGPSNYTLVKTDLSL